MEGPLDLHFPPQALSDIAEGDKLRIHMAFSATPQPEGALTGQQLEGEHTMTGTVTTVGKTLGNLSLNTGEGPLILAFPPQAIADLSQGDTITIYLGFAEAQRPTAAMGGTAESGAAGTVTGGTNNAPQGGQSR